MRRSNLPYILDTQSEYRPYSYSHTRYTLDNFAYYNEFASTIFYQCLVLKHPPDVNVSDSCIDANLKMVERRDPDNFPRFPPQE